MPLCMYMKYKNIKNIIFSNFHEFDENLLKFLLLRRSKLFLITSITIHEEPYIQFSKCLDQAKNYSSFVDNN